jgi:hypothetical protein
VRHQTARVAAPAVRGVGRDADVSDLAEEDLGARRRDDGRAGGRGEDRRLGRLEVRVPSFLGRERRAKRLELRRPGSLEAEQIAPGGATRVGDAE